MMEFLTAAVIIIAIMVAVIGIRQDHQIRRDVEFEEDVSTFLMWFYKNINFAEKENVDEAEKNDHAR